MPSFQTYLKAIKSEVAETDVGTVHKAIQGPRGEQSAAPVLVDVREQDEYVQGFIPGARWIPRGFLELRIEEQVPERDRPIVLYCAGGTRSALAARSLRDLGYTRVLDEHFFDLGREDV